MRQRMACRAIASFLHHVSVDRRGRGSCRRGFLRTYPDEMTIILQHQFWDLVVHDDRFEVGLSFGGIPERLLVPFSAIKSFFDPSVQFGSAIRNRGSGRCDGDRGRRGHRGTRKANLPASPAPSALAASAGVPGPLPRRPKSRRNRARAPRSCASIASARSRPQRETVVMAGCVDSCRSAPLRRDRGSGAGPKTLAYCMMHSISSCCLRIHRALQCGNAH